MIEMFGAVPSKQLSKLNPDFVREDLEVRFRKILIDEMQLNPSLKVNYVAAENSLNELTKKMETAYNGELQDEDCSLVEIKVSVEVKVVK